MPILSQAGDEDANAGGHLVNLCNGIAVFFLLQVLWSYYWTCYRKGYTIDLWHFSLLNMAFVVHVMLPFDRSDLNIFALGPGLLPGAQASMTEAYLISTLGYACVLLGGSLWRVELGLGLRRFLMKVMELPASGSLLLLRNRQLLLVHSALAVMMLVGILSYYWTMSGFGLNLRGLLLVRTDLRPLAQFTAFYSVLIASHCLARWTALRERSMVLVVVPIVVGLMAFGERANLLSLSLLPLLVVFMRMRRRLKLSWLLVGAVSALVLSVLLNILRDPTFQAKDAGARIGMDVFFGNSFSDTRDFAVVLSFWKGEYFYGMTYLAGLLSFIPRVLSPFRDKWAIGVVTATLAGFSPKEHPGLRPGTFGEAFFNFGLPGVVLLGIGLGASIRFLDMRMKQALLVLPARSLKVFSYNTLGLFLGAAIISANASAVYSVLLIFLVSWIFLKFLAFLHLEQPGA